MILVDAGERTAAAFQAKILFAGLLAQEGYRPAIDENTVPPALSRSEKYEVSRYLTDVSAGSISLLFLVGAQRISDDTAALLRSYRLGPDTRVIALGAFADHQMLIHARSKLAYATGREVEVVNLADEQKGPSVSEGWPSQIAPTPRERPEGARKMPVRVTFLTTEAAILSPETTLALDMLLANPALRVTTVILPAHERGPDPQLSGGVALWLDDLPPAAIAAQTDVAVVAGEIEIGERLGQTLLAAIAGGAPVIDCTVGNVLLTAGAPVVRGPDRIEALARHIETTVLLNRAEIARFMRQSPWLARRTFARLQETLALPWPDAHPGVDATRRTIYMPTNGVGLGHAQRLSLIAAAVAPPDRARFAAFPSCVPLLEAQGFPATPLVQKSDDHPEGYANDIVNYRRLDRLLQPGDPFVFDGGYVFDSIFRLVREKDLAACWVRRGLWQATQSNARTLARGRVFRQVVVPEEAFEELNAPVEWGRSVTHVGPVVQVGAPPDPGLRDRLAERLGISFDKLVVSMLGGGVAADRDVQLHALCQHFAARPGHLHLILAWPGARVDSRHYQWPNTRVVQTRQALDLMQAADLVISAAGYNSFHEILYHHLPAIFVPQMAPYMDDQLRRARAASERDLAATVEAHEILSLLREADAFLTEGKAQGTRDRLKAFALPERGTDKAASVIRRMVET